MISLELLEPYNKFFKITYTKNNISTYLIHRIDVSIDIVLKYNVNLLKNYLEKIPKQNNFNLKEELLFVCKEVNERVPMFLSKDY